MKKLENIRVNGIKYVGHDGNPLEELRLEVRTDKGLLRVNTDKVELVSKYGVVLVEVQDEGGDVVATDNAVLVAAVASAIDAFENKDVWLGHNQEMAVPTEEQANDILAKLGIPIQEFMPDGVCDINGKEVA